MKRFAEFTSTATLPVTVFTYWLTGISGGLQLHSVPVLNKVSNSRLVIFNENKTEGAGPSEPRLESWAVPPTSRAKENEPKLEKWCDVKVRGNPVLVYFCNYVYCSLFEMANFSY